jgi:hypothetical protein
MSFFSLPFPGIGSKDGETGKRTQTFFEKFKCAGIKGGGRYFFKHRNLRKVKPSLVL